MDLALIDFDHMVSTCDTYSRFLRGDNARHRHDAGPARLGHA